MILELNGKRLELLREIAPRVSRIAFLTYGTDVTARKRIKELADTGRRFGVRIQPLGIQDPKDLEGAFSAMSRERAGAVAIQPLLITSIGQGHRIAEFAARKSFADQFRIRKIFWTQAAWRHTGRIAWRCGGVRHGTLTKY